MADIVGNKTLRDQWEELACVYGNDLFLIFEDCTEKTYRFTYRNFYRRINQTSNLFLELGIQKGEHVAVQLRNSPEFLLCWFGLAQIGAVIVPLNTAYTAHEFTYILEKCQAVAVVVEPDFLQAHLDSHGYRPRHRILARGEVCEEAWLDFEALVEAQPETLLERRQLSSDDAAEILFTSGTTARPKGAVMTHCNMLVSGIVHAWQCGLRHSDRFMTAMPCFHIDFQFMAVMSALTVGGTVVVMEHYSARRFWKQICKYEADVTDTMPMLIHTMMMQPQQEWERHHHVRQVYFSMGMSEQEKNAFEERFQVRLLNCYGSTETVSCVTGDPEYGLRRWPSVGRPALGYEICITGQDGEVLSAGEVGEIQVHGVPGRTLMKEYYKDAEATARVLSETGWFRTGDKGYLDADGWLYFVDRDSNMIKRSGENISSIEVENVLTSHPEICEAAVIGVPDQLRGQIVKAIVHLAEGSRLTKEDILDYCSGRLAEFKHPAVIEIREDLPHTCTGKIQKELLKG